MAHSWTPAQLSAIEMRDKTLLVSAAAGSGKTATLTERIIRSLTDDNNPADISRMLIATFTRASAADLREKISAALSKKLAENPTNRNLADQLVALGSAHISTIDSFYLDILKTHFGRLSLSQAPRIIDDSESKPLNLSTMDEVIEEFYENKEGFDRFIENFTSVRDNSKVAEVFISIYDKLLAQRDGVETLKGYISDLQASTKNNLFDTKYGKIALDKLSTFLRCACRFTKEAYELILSDEKATKAYGDAFSSDLEYWNTLDSLLCAPDYDAIKAIMDRYNKIKPDTLRGNYDEIRALLPIRNLLHEDFERIKDNYFCYTKDETVKSFADNAKICSTLYELLSEFDFRIMGEKASRGICTFADIRRYVLQILCDKDGSPNEIAAEYRERFDYIYIDEYQDVDPVQDSIFTILSKPDNRFMVGDIKQSIYGFRNADPSIFADYKKTLPALGSKQSDGYSIFMSNNFRCDESVIDFSNAVSSFLFSNRSQSIDYSSKDDLIFSKEKPSPEYHSTPVKVVTTGILPSGVGERSLDDEQTDRLKRSSARYIAEEIERLVGNEFLADTKDENGNLIKKKISYGDIAIFSRQKKRLPLIIDELQKRGIPVECEKDSDFFENPDVLLVLSFLSAIDNPQKDISLAGALRSPFFGFTLEEIYTVKSSAAKSASLYDALVSYSTKENELAEKCKAFDARLQYWRNAAASTPCDKLIKKLYHEMAILSYGSAKSRNLLKLYEYAIKFESSGFKGLYGFIKYVNDLIECEVKLPDTESGGSADSVKIMTIHHSKGLEFPVCFIFDCEKRFSNNTAKQDIQFEPSLGIGFTPHDESGFAKFNSPTWRSICDTCLLLEKEEEMRLLYVAMTRARERLYLVSNIHKPENKETIRMLAKVDTEYAILRAGSYVDWMIMALDRPDLPDCFTTEEIIFDCENTEKADVITDTQKDELTEESPNANTKIVELLKERFDFKYAYEHISKLPAKLSVSSLSPDILDKYDGDAASLSLLNGNFNDNFRSDFAVPETLLSKKAATASEIGTATHAFLQFCNFENAVKCGIDEEISRMTVEKFISPKYGDIIDKKQLEGFFESELYKRISSAKRIWREQRFNLFLPASEFTQDAEKSVLLEGETVAVQGVIDIFFEDTDGKIILCDYKTDYLKADELANPTLAAQKLSKRHAEQLFYYAKAIEEMLGKAPDEIIIYSLPLGNHVMIEK